MCFTVDHDWYAEVVEDRIEELESPVRCFECHRQLSSGVQARCIDMTQHELCVHDPDSGDYSGPETDRVGCLEDCEHDFGETFSCVVCLECDKLLKAIAAAEFEAGCHPNESQPAFGELGEAMTEDDQNRYRIKAAVLFPELAEHIVEYYPARNSDD